MKDFIHGNDFATILFIYYLPCLFFNQKYTDCYISESLTKCYALEWLKFGLKIFAVFVPSTQFIEKSCYIMYVAYRNSWLRSEVVVVFGKYVKVLELESNNWISVAPLPLPRRNLEPAIPTPYYPLTHTFR